MTISEMLLFASIIGALTVGMVIGIIAGIDWIDIIRRKRGCL